MAGKEIDGVTGIETTGHSWDGVKELNNPLPRWWVIVFWVSVIWSVAYWIFMPSWPGATGYLQGVRNHSERANVEAAVAELQATRGAQMRRLLTVTSIDEIENDPELQQFAMTAGESIFGDNCATCHGTGGAGAKGYPNLNDDDWLWGGTLSDIHQTLQYGIRVSGSYDTHLSQMTAFGKDKILKKDEIEAVVDYVLAMSGGKTYGQEARGEVIYKEQCASCHGENGKGMKEFGAPNLTDKIWLYGGDRKDIYQTVYSARSGMMPAWGGRLDKNTLKQLTIYLHQLGGGEEEPEYGPRQK